MVQKYQKCISVLLAFRSDQRTVSFYVQFLTVAYDLGALKSFDSALRRMTLEAYD